MQTVKTLTQKQGRFIYLVFTISGLLMLLLAQDFSWAGISFALALVFNPYPEKKFTNFNAVQKAHILGQMGLAILFIGISLYQTVSN
jgi:hypothetical protein